MLRIARSVLQNKEEVEDLVQDVFVFLFFKGKLFDPSKGSARAWLLQITYRAYDRRRYLTARLFYDQAKKSPIGGVLLSMAGDSPEEFLAWQSFLRPAFQELSEDQRKTLTLHFYEGYTLRETVQTGALRDDSQTRQTLTCSSRVEVYRSRRKGRRHRWVPPPGTDGANRCSPRRFPNTADPDLLKPGRSVPKQAQRPPASAGPHRRPPHAQTVQTGACLLNHGRSVPKQAQRPPGISGSPSPARSPFCHSPIVPRSREIPGIGMALAQHLRRWHNICAVAKLSQVDPLPRRRQRG